MVLIGLPQPGEYPPFAQAYIDHVQSDDAIGGLERQVEKTVALLRPLGDDRALYSYAPGKWTIKELINHMSDTERIFSARTLRIARGDKTALPAFDQEPYVPAARSNERRLDNLLDEFIAVRRSTIALVRSLPSDAWSRSGTVNIFPVTVRGLVFTMVGHELHHYDLLRTKYLA